MVEVKEKKNLTRKRIWRSGESWNVLLCEL